MKIAVIGYSGSGKSTLAETLAKGYDIPLLHLDKVHWLPGWQERPREEGRAMVEAYLDKHPDWVIDGNYSHYCYERRLEEADRIILMQLPRLQCLFRVWKRVIKYKNKSRSSITEGCPEKIDGEFIVWILWKGRRKKNREAFRRIAEQYRDKTIRLTSQREIDDYLVKMKVSS